MVACVEDGFYKITSEALLVTQELVSVMTPQGATAAAAAAVGGFDPTPFVQQV